MTMIADRRKEDCRSGSCPESNGRTIAVFLVACVVLCIFSGSSTAYATTSEQGVTSEHIDIYGLSFEKYDYGSSYLIEPSNLLTSRNEVDNSIISSDCGLLYLLANGYPAIDFPHEGPLDERLKNDIDYFVTQVAVWLYLGFEKEHIVSEFPKEAEELVEKLSVPLAQEAAIAAQKSYEEIRCDCVIHLEGIDDGLLRLVEDRYESFPQKVTIVGGREFRVDIEGLSSECVRNGDNVERLSFWSGESFMVSIPSTDLVDSTEVKAVVSCEAELPVLKLGESDFGKRIVRLESKEGASSVSKTVSWKVFSSPDSFLEKSIFVIVTLIFLIIFVIIFEYLFDLAAIALQGAEERAKGGNDGVN